ncbi:Predicted transcriptional regulator [Clostridium sp. USBA 49]|jgi:predicted transcriptional regulator|uniref:ArsR/SmtB family transcription factor n=1 Tax=Clostridium TaxID=1485 RepID=UPI00099AB5E2|nr:MULTISPECIES: ArsR family transcriptional regulator [Clostridium]SKA85542.1 Predicted transcriptional regulator [Clostridium sp. USBA 49]
MSKEIELSLEKPEELYTVAKALASEIRIEIIKLLNFNSLNVNEISECLGIPASTAAVNVKILEEAGLIHTELQPGTRGSMKLCSRKRDFIQIILKSSKPSSDKSYYINMPIGSYVDCKAYPTCGIVTDKGYLGVEDDPRSFYDPLRINAQLIWFHKGYLEYRFPNTVLEKVKAKMIEISVEVCSEAPNFRNEWPSDITMWVNGIECGTWTSPGDFGGRRGKLNPIWWSDGSTQFGMLKTWRITKEGAFIDGKKVSNININKLDLEKNDFISVRIGIKDDAKNIGGMNLFGDNFGDYPQHIVMRIDY